MTPVFSSGVHIVVGAVLYDERGNDVETADETW